MGPVIRLTAESPGSSICSRCLLCSEFQEITLYDASGLVRSRHIIREAAGDFGFVGVEIGDTAT